MHDVIIIGAGPSGLMVANVLEKAKIDYRILEKNDRPGIKLLLTGNKRCNVTNRLSNDAFIQALTLRHRRFLYPSLGNMNTEGIVSFFRQKGLNLVLEDGFKYFPETHASQHVLDALLRDINKRNILYRQHVIHINKISGGYEIQTKLENFQTRRLVLAMGSKAFPQTGSNGEGLLFAEHMGLPFVPFSPAETHLYLKSPIKHFQGISIKNTQVVVKGSKKKYQGDLLFTHFGLSGPVIYHASEELFEMASKKPVTLGVSLTSQSALDVEKMLKQGMIQQQSLQTTLEHLMQKRLVPYLMNALSLTHVKMNQLSPSQLTLLKDRIIQFPLDMDKVESVEKAYVNKGGILTRGIDPNTMEVKNFKGLYVVGELLDLHGPIGGFNLTIAFSTGYTCGLAIQKDFPLSLKI